MPGMPQRSRTRSIQRAGKDLGARILKYAILLLVIIVAGIVAGPSVIYGDQEVVAHPWRRIVRVRKPFRSLHLAES